MSGATVFFSLFLGGNKEVLHKKKCATVMLYIIAKKTEKVQIQDACEMVE